MRCPRCDEWVPASAASCSKCGLDVAALHSLDEIKASLRSSTFDFDAAARRLHELQERVDSLESMLQAQLAASIPPVADSEEITGRPEETLEPLEPEPAASLEDNAETFEAERVPPLPAGTRGFPPGRFAGSGGDEAELRLGLKWMLIAGVVVTVLAVGYFLKYSFDRNWVGPAGRVALAYTGGLACLGLGEAFRRKLSDIFGLYLIGGGIAILYFSSYAAFQIYDLMTQPSAFGIMILVTALAGALAVLYDTKWLAVLGIVGGFLTPVVLSTGTDNQIGLMSYMTILNGGILLIAAFKRWNLLNYLAAFFTWALFSAWYVEHYNANNKFWTTTSFLNLFFLIHAIVPFVYFFVRKTAEQMRGFSITIPNAFIAFGYSFAMIREVFSVQWVSVVALAYSAVFLSLATHLYRRNREVLDAFVLLLAKGILFLVITVPLLFSEHWITVFWAVQGAVLIWAAYRLGSVRLRYGAIALVMLAAGKLAFYDYQSVFHYHVDDFSFRYGFTAMLLERSVAVVVVLGALLRSAQMAVAAAKAGKADKEDAHLLYIIFSVLLFGILNAEVAACFYHYAPQARFASISVLWALFSIALMVAGFIKNLSVLRRCSIGLFAITILKVFLRDMVRVSTPYRIISFLVLGLMLIGASYLYHRYKSRILPAQPDEEAAS
ncbi:MAG: DUF2339 domain-containing protein [Phycisphaerales bacterium]|nr:MAG: DUF2339 domain-containing protein [Phycisphaerales bacterium]